MGRPKALRAGAVPRRVTDVRVVAATGLAARARTPSLTQVISPEGIAQGAVTLPAPALVALFRAMLLGRELDERMMGLQRQGRIGFYVGATGEEAAIVGTTAAMEEQDWLFPCYREHVAALMRGMPLATLFCNMLGNSGDVVRGRQMPCHETWRPGRFTSVSAPLATQLPHAVGAALAARLRGDDMVALTWFGDGATSATDFHVALNFAGTSRAPVVFACRNNGWAISTPRELQTASETIAQKATAYGIHAERVDGNDVLAVHEATRRARSRAGRGEGATLLELVTYRVGSHTSSDDPRAYRDERLVEPWKKRDPILRLARFLRREGILSENDESELRESVREAVQEAIRTAESQPPRPTEESLFEDVYAEPQWQQREQIGELRGQGLTTGG